MSDKRWAVMSMFGLKQYRDMLQRSFTGLTTEGRQALREVIEEIERRNIEQETTDGEADSV
jgi:hypothetical protein